MPEFQRPYSWDDDQIEQFWEDVYSEWRENKDSRYFFGSMIFAKETERYGYKYIVIDGQQRLTTLLILLCVVRDLFLKNKDKSKEFSSEFKDRIKHCIRYFGRFKLKLQPEHNYVFENTILKGIRFPNIKSKKELQSLRQENKYLYVAHLFKEKLLELYKSMGSKGIESFISYVLDNVEIVEILTSDIPKAIWIFQVVNTRGLELSPADIIKVNLYTETSEDYREDFKILWHRLESVATEFGRDLAELFTYYAYYRLAPNRPRRAVHEVIGNIFNNDKRNGWLTTNFLYDVKEFVDAIRDIEESQSDRTILTMRYLPNETYWLTVLASAKKENYRDFKNLAKEIRRFFYLYWIAGYTTQKVRQPSLRIIDMIKRKKPVDVIREEIKNRLEEDDVYRLAIENLNGNVYGQRWLKPLLLMIEYEHSEPAKIVYLDLKNVHIEHILPQKWKGNNYWKERWDENNAKKWLNKLGNLTLLYKRMNEKIRNASFPVKLKYYKGLEKEAPTSFILTRKLWQYNDWTPREVDNRHRWIMNEIINMLNIPRKYFNLDIL